MVRPSSQGEMPPLLHTVVELVGLRDGLLFCSESACMKGLSGFFSPYGI